MKPFLHLLLVLCLLIYPSAAAWAGPQEDYEEAYKIYLAAATSAAAYSDRLGELSTRYLEQDGWQIDHYVQPQGRSGVRYLIAQKNNTPFYFIAIVGTENEKDVKLDLKVDKVPFTGATDEEISAAATQKNVPDTEPKVHKGFNQFLQAGPAATLRSPRQGNLALPDLLTANKDRKLYLTGHSLGGAAATLGGARLISTGMTSGQLEVITFGAPAVGNAAFAAKFAPILPVTRIVQSGDPVTGVLQTLFGGYQQFGREIKWPAPAFVSDSHQLTGYIDSAIKNYYDKRRLAMEAGMPLPAFPAFAGASQDSAYILPLKNSLPENLTTEFWYMTEALQDEYRRTFSRQVTPADMPDSWQQAAAASGCRWVIASEVSASRVKQEKNAYYITLTQTIYDATTGAVADTAIYSTGTYTLTPLEAFIHAFKEMNIHLNSRLTKTAI